MNNIMKSPILTLAPMLLIPILITACGGGGGGDSAPPAPVVKPIENTANIVASRDFSFDVSEKITLSLDYIGTSEGALHLYTKAAHVFTNGDVAADPTSRITTIYPTLTNEVELEVNSNWRALYAEWVPMNSAESEVNVVIHLDQPSNAYHITF
ncbi:hypothetical protein MD535_02105 [Vibrio sp. ZSDZ65]|uniref:PLAT domain-containing protein n=1 Tax=Vibrio qingdaonensis TaxID=2829491 RepID=A0A9X3CJY7_9VIBR|nr:hypothetical protein [Vibrio qingdaonensis]MCW8344818.1 hypothetical protein [Vibrio qingdaonensis]